MLLAFFHCNHVKGMQILLADYDTLSGSRQMKRNIRHFLLMINLFFPPIDLTLAEAALHWVFLLPINPTLFLPHPAWLWLETRQIEYPILMCVDLLTEEVTVLEVQAIIIFLAAHLVVLRGNRIKRLDQVHLLLLMSRVTIHLLLCIIINES